MALELRPYQAEAVESVFDYFRSGNVGNPLIALPTGTGKSLVISGFLKEAYQRYGTQRVMILTHVKELIKQNFSEIVDYWPTTPAGIYSSGLKRRDIGYPITFAGIASVHKIPEDFGKIDLVMIDEAHLVSPHDTTMYRKFIDSLIKQNRHLKSIGLTATPYRPGQGMLTDEGGIFTDICYDKTDTEGFNYFLDEGYLTYLITPGNLKVEIDVSNVGTTAGEFNQKQLAQASDKEEITRAACLEAADLASDRNHWLVFASGIEHTVHVAEMLNSIGVSATYVHSKMSEKDRDANIAAFMAGKYRAMVNNGILTTGFNFKNIDCIVMLRATKSPGLWVQMLGRGTRPLYAPGFDLSTTNGRLWGIFNSLKRNCLVLDFAGNTKRLGPVNDPRIPKKKGKGGGEAPYRICHVCGVINHAAAIKCINCGQEFPRAVNITAEASTSELITKGLPELVDFKVTHTAYALHAKPGRPKMLKATYRCGFRWFDEYVLLDHTGNARLRAERWWRRFSPGTTEPENVDEAMRRLNELHIPSFIKVWVNRKPNPEVRDYVFPNELEESQAENRIPELAD
jgi:DNA repair protein RadD